MRFSRRSATTGALLFAGFAALAVPHAAAAQAARPLTAEQVACDADQLRAVLGRSAVLFSLFYDDRTVMFLVTYGAPSGVLSGLAVMEQSDLKGQILGPEHQLAFTVGASRRQPQRDPAQPQVSALNMMREPLSSDLGLLEDPWAMDVLIDPTVNPQTNHDATTLLVVDNVDDTEGGAPSDSKAGRGLQSLLNRCHNAFTAADLHVFDVLSRVLRAAAFTTRDSDPKAERMHKLASLYRGADAVAIPGGGVRASYRLDLFPVVRGETLKRVSLEIKVDLGADGSLGDATMRVLPACHSADQAACSNATGEAVVSVIQPAASDRVWEGAAPTVCWNGGPQCPSQTAFSFAERLAGTTWQQP